jgi:hypothetical protein
MSFWAYAALAVGTAVSVAGYDQAGRAEKIRQDEVARQAKENAEMVKLNAEIAATARSRTYTNFLKNSSAITGFNRRGDDRSLKAIQKAGKTKSAEELKAAELQSLFTRGRYASQAKFAAFEGQTAMDQALMNQVSTVTSNGYKATTVT